jgi:hypothetical protein
VWGCFDTGEAEEPGGGTRAVDIGKTAPQVHRAFFFARESGTV